MAGNDNLHMSKSAKTDEFYTQLGLIENELRHYKDHFRDKVVLCNCDDPYESNFFKYFAMNFNSLGLKKLIATCYSGSIIAGDEIPYYQDPDGQLSFIPLDGYDHISKKKAYCVQINSVSDENGDGRIDLSDVEYLIKNSENTLSLLEGSGDFRSPECIEFLEEADIVVTNPPFSLFRQYMALLMEYGKKFIIIGNQNNVTYAEVFPLIQSNKIWLGYNNGHFWFRVPDSYEEKKTDFRIDENGVKWRRMGNICWYTNLDIDKRHEDMILYKTYSPELYPKYDNYNVIEVSRTLDIPCDYYDVMGVPITFMQYFNPDQFEIVGMAEDNGSGFSGEAAMWDGKNPHCVINGGKPKYKRIFIRRRTQS